MRSSRMKATKTSSANIEPNPPVSVDKDSDLSVASTEDEPSDIDADWINIEQEKALTSILVANAKRKSPQDISKLSKKLVKVGSFIHIPESSAGTDTFPNDKKTKVVLRDFQLEQITENAFENPGQREEEVQQHSSDINKERQDLSQSLQALQDIDEEIPTEAYVAQSDSNHSDKESLDGVRPITKDRSQSRHKIVSSWDKYFREVDKHRGLTNEDKFLRSYFTREMWKEDSKSNVMIREVDTSIDDALDEAELIKSDNFEAQHNFRYERGSARTQVIGHSRTDDAFKPIKKLSKRAKQRLNKKERIQAELEQKKRNEGLDGASSIPLSQLETLDEDFPSDQEWFLCDACDTPIEGGQTRYDCVETDCDYSLCKRCQKTVRHDHGLHRVKTPIENKPPASWSLAVAEKKNIDMTDLIVRNVLKNLTFKIDENFKYIECPELDFGLSSEDLLTIKDETLNSLAPPCCLEPYEDPAKVAYLYKKGLRKVLDYKKKLARESKSVVKNEKQRSSKIR